jgi:hypothetical protein
MVRKWWPFTCFILFVLMLTPDISGQQRTGQFGVGGHFGLLFNSDKVADKKIVLPEFGGTLTYFFSKRLGLEAETSFYVLQRQEVKVQEDGPGNSTSQLRVQLFYVGQQRFVATGQVSDHSIPAVIEGHAVVRRLGTAVVPG